MLLDLPEIDYERTRQNFLKYMDEYIYLLALQPVRIEPQITQSFSFIPPATNNELNNIERSASKNIKREQLFKRRDKILTELHTAVDMLPPEEKFVIVKNYLNQNTTVEVYVDLNISKTHFHKVKRNAIKRLSFYLGIEVYKSDT